MMRAWRIEFEGALNKILSRRNERTHNDVADKE